jgi:hypothetical protein
MLASFCRYIVMFIVLALIGYLRSLPLPCLTSWFWLRVSFSSVTALASRRYQST